MLFYFSLKKGGKEVALPPWFHYETEKKIRDFAGRGEREEKGSACSALLWLDCFGDVKKGIGRVDHTATCVRSEREGKKKGEKSGRHRLRL